MPSSEQEFINIPHLGRRAVLASVFALLLSSCTSDQKPGDPALKAITDKATTDTSSLAKVTTGPGATDTVAVEAVGTIDFNGSAVTASVISTGCTLLEHFKVEYDVRDDTCHVTLVRTKADFCRRVPFFMEVTVPWEPPVQCAQMTVEFANPIIDMDKNTIKESTGKQLPEQ